MRATNASARALESRLSRRNVWMLLAALVSVGASMTVGAKLADHRGQTTRSNARWQGKVAKIARSGASNAELGVFAESASGKTPLAEGSEIPAGAKIGTDARTRVRLELRDGSVFIVDRDSLLSFADAPRTVNLERGAIVADVAHLAGAPNATMKTANGEVRVLGTRLALTAATERTNVEVLRGRVEVATAREHHDVFAGEEGVAMADGKIDVTPVSDLAQRTAFGAELSGSHNEDAEAPASGLGELRAKRPGRSEEKDHAVRLRKHAVKVRIAGNVARTEIDETFANETDEELEGIYRFPIPSGAQIERLALEVDGALVEGEFVDRNKASAIWRGAIHNAAPKEPKPREELVWVPGPWHDPALLEWQRGGRSELRIFPIPKRGSRRVVIAYTETVAPSSGIRRYVYPLPQGASSKLTIDDFSVDAKVLGHDTHVPVRVRGYELEAEREDGAEVFRGAVTGFTPSGDLSIEYGHDDKNTDVSAWAYRGEATAGTTKAKVAVLVGSDPFVAIALRPKLPKWSSVKPRDQVIVIDVGRTMFGERIARAKRLAVQMTQEMDRRDRVTVLACDVTCRALPSGFAAPGAPTANDVDAFLRGTTTEGASDLVGAVRSATKLAGHDEGRDLRIVVLSDGVATAGYRTPSRVASEVADAVADSRASIVAVPIGSDADTDVLASMARGGGGVVVPYQPGQRLESTAIEVLNATYGTTLRDVELVLPDGLHGVAPAVLAPMRAGSETIVVARMNADRVHGDVVLRGKVGGEPFEAKYALEVTASTDRANAFVPRLYAAARIEDRERDTDPKAHAELVALSRRFSVPSRTTSLLVLESEAMFTAFGIQRADRHTTWSGESAARGTTVASAGKADETDLGLSALADDAYGAGSAELGPKDKAAESANRPTPPAPAATAAPMKRAAPKTLDRAEPWGLMGEGGGGGGGWSTPAPAWEPPPNDFRGGRLMKKVWVRHATVRPDIGSPVAADKLARARAAVVAAPDERSKHKELARLLAASGQLDELEESLEKWSMRDPLDVDVVGARADLAARRGDREGALRILGGSLAATGMASSDAYTLAVSLGRSYERLARPESCAFDITAAELRPGDASALVRAITCEQGAGRTASADRWLAGVTESIRRAVRAALAKPSPRAEKAFGDIVVSATWSGNEDVDVAIVEPMGRRASLVSRLSRARVEGGASLDHETIAYSSGDAGAFIIELARSDAARAAHGAVHGTVTVKAFGEARTLPFTLTGDRVVAGRVDVRWDSELVPVADFPPRPDRRFQPWD